MRTRLLTSALALTLAVGLGFAPYQPAEAG